MSDLPIANANDAAGALDKSGPMAEVLTSSITGLMAETLPSKIDPKAKQSKPQFGSFVRIESPENQIEIFAVVFDIVTNPPDLVHKPAALGMTRDQLRLEQPHIFALLKTQIQAAVVGFASTAADSAKKNQVQFYQHLPPQPAAVHDFVYEATDIEIIKLTSDFEFLRLLTHVSVVPTDELIAATVRCAAAARKFDQFAQEEYLVEAGRAISQLFRSDYDRMVAIIKKIKPT